MISLVDHFVTLARYNTWANRLVYASAAELSEAQYRADRGAFFKSVHGTLNHLLVTDQIWLARCGGTPEVPLRLDQTLFESFTPLHEARVDWDQRIESFVGGLTVADMEKAIRYRRASAPEPAEQDLASVLSHWFNHQTHHRGQVHALLTGLTGHAPALDLLFYQRARKAIPA